MQLSLFTPTHDPKHLLDAYDSIVSQDFLEWVICPNAACTSEQIPATIVRDPRVKIVPVPEQYLAGKHSENGRPNIGALKRFACEQCTGDVFVELDHDDMIPDGTLAKIAEAFEDPKVVGLHTNFAEYNESDWTPRSYSADYGWQYRPVEYRGHQLLEAIAPGASPHHCASMYFCPNHTRAWRASTYRDVGGYNAELPVADDMDLICRLFCAGEIFHLDVCGAIYRVNGANTYMARSDRIWQLVPMLRDKYLAQMAEAECKRNGWRMLDLGGRFNSPPGYESVDLNGGDIRADLSKSYPFDDSSIGIVRAGDFLEHITDKMHSLREIHRVLRPGGHLFSKTPSTCGPKGEAGMGADQDPTHVSRWNRNSFWYVTKAATAKFIDNTEVRFYPIINENYYPDDWCRENHIPYVRFVGLALKDGYRPHGCIEI